MKAEPGEGPVIAMKGAKMTEVLVPLGFLVAWVVLQVWVLPRFGIKT